ncbi:uncharacterized protein LOC108112216 [Drosophila eugracilis]|uniref:uncharacterized protein LOC108112216 n=1 Tax=Drosophila eugracilis TaxID=29029 RepID=UPI0007E80671|nr:uncharacterized protein LOC108112216 [Drosophila eugracilis]
MLKLINPLVLCFLPLIFLLIESRAVEDHRIVFPKDNDEDTNASRFIYPWTNSTTKTPEEPQSTTTKSALEVSNSTTISGSEELVNETTTEIPTIDNRILLETRPICKPGYELHGKRCRKPA